MARRVTTRDKWKAKSWYTVLAPEEFGEREIGETPAADPKEVKGRTVEVSARDVAEGKGLNHVKLIFEVQGVTGKSAKTRMAGYEVARSYIRSLVRRRRKRMDLVKDLEVDGRKVRFKLVAMTLGKCYGNARREIRRIMDETLTESVKGKSLAELMAAVLNREIQDGIREKARKVFPIAGLEIRKMEL